MDQERFDGIAKELAAATSRRGVVRGVGLGLVASMFGLTSPDASQARRRRRRVRAQKGAPGGCNKYPFSKCGTRGKQQTCFNLDNDDRNCGACGRVCASGEACQNGQCLSTNPCSAGQTLCGGACVDLTSDLDNCGYCGNVCTSRTGFRGCCPRSDGSGSQCVDLGDNNSNCGQCGHVCPSCNGQQSCMLAVNGTQRTPVCASGGTCRPPGYDCTSDGDCPSGTHCLTSPDNVGTTCVTVCAQTC